MAKSSKKGAAILQLVAEQQEPTIVREGRPGRTRKNKATAVVDTLTDLVPLAFDAAETLSNRPPDEVTKAAVETWREIATTTTDQSERLEAGKELSKLAAKSSSGLPWGFMAVGAVIGGLFVAKLLQGDD